MSRVDAKVSASLLAAGLAVPAFGALALSAPAQAAGGCTSPTSGVTVVVQVPTGTAVSCAPGNPGTALNALRAAGFSTVGSPRFGDAFLCRVNGYPSGVPCQDISHEYWYIYTAQRGGSWQEGHSSIAEQSTPPGSVIGFRFQKSTEQGDKNLPPSVPVPAKVTTPKPSTPSQPTKGSTPAGTPKHTSAPSKTSHTTASQTTSGHSSVGMSHPSATVQSTAAPTSGGMSNGANQPASTGPAPTVKATAVVTQDGKQRKVVTFSDGSKQTVDASSEEAKKLVVGAPRPASSGAGNSASPTSTSGGKPNSTTPGGKPSSTSVAPPKSTAAPSDISTSGSVPLPTTQAPGGGSSNLPGLVVGGAALCALAAGGAYVAMRRRG